MLGSTACTARALAARRISPRPTWRRQMEEAHPNRCPACQSPNVHVLETRETAKHMRRRRICQDCRHRFTTRELV